MKSIHNTALIVGVAMVAIFWTACKKESANKKTCSTSLHAFTAPLPLSSISYTCKAGLINTSTGAITYVGSFSGRLPLTQRATFNTTDNCYYVFGDTATVVGATPAVLFRVSASGTSAFFPATGSAALHYGIVYNSYNNRLYTIRDYMLAELSISGGSYTSSAVGIGDTLDYYANMTVNTTTGEIYYVAGSAVSGRVLKRFNPVTGAVVPISVPMGGSVVSEIRYNNNDGNLYCVAIDTGTYVKKMSRINPSAGTLTSLAVIDSLNVDFYSATMDECNNRYVISTGYMSVHLLQYSITGALLQDDITSSFYQGMDATH